ncbi:uncharacterized protein B0I36DRAFT_309982 [Microdochium trichocladiopsis]|uniref:C2H2-type domain-containing protein n=1 Tax=Microdochium trichocladiopsis TaxID=1682393 RepID=A0A9P8YGT8_9PEZI|nr:uncharacterized protein B0I36DRAFT_309982 [Microdochium trichocladiopsis]KAH7040129.1 hypothetical protein B0I36DRAFT_309982 [Microdochium trichocladiopsis]
MDSNGRPYCNGHPAVAQGMTPNTLSGQSRQPHHSSFSSGSPFTPQRESPAAVTTSQIRPPQLPDWARPKPPVSSAQDGHMFTGGGQQAPRIPVRPRSPAKQHRNEQQQQELLRTSAGQEGSPAPQFTVQIKSSPIKETSLYRKVDDAPSGKAPTTTTPVVPRQGRKRPQPGAMGVVNMFAAITNDVGGGGSGGGVDGLPSTPGSINKRGRPKGWKPGMSYAAIRGNPPPGSGSTAAREREKGLAKRLTTLHDIARRQYLRAKPDFAPFVCEWVEESGEQCPAELQNLDTLRRHLFCVHVAENSEQEEESGREIQQIQQICRWAKCARHDPPIVYNSEDALDDHIEAHLQVIAWFVGDGHQNKGAAKQHTDTIPSYLLGKDGTQATPSIKDQQLETESQRKERKRKLRALEAQRDEHAPDEEEFMKQTLGTADEAGEEQA